MDLSDIGSIGWAIESELPQTIDGEPVRIRVDAFLVARDPSGKIGLDERGATFENGASHCNPWIDMVGQTSANRKLARTLISTINNRGGESIRTGSADTPIASLVGQEDAIATYEGVVCCAGTVGVCSVQGIALSVAYEPKTGEVDRILTRLLGRLLQEHHPKGIVAAVPA